MQLFGLIRLVQTNNYLRNT